MLTQAGLTWWRKSVAHSTRAAASSRASCPSCRFMGPNGLPAFSGWGVSGHSVTISGIMMAVLSKPSTGKCSSR